MLCDFKQLLNSNNKINMWPKYNFGNYLLLIKKKAPSDCQIILDTAFAMSNIFVSLWKLSLYNLQAGQSEDLCHIKITIFTQKFGYLLCKIIPGYLIEWGKMNKKYVQNHQNYVLIFLYGIKKSVYNNYYAAVISRFHKIYLESN